MLRKVRGHCYANVLQLLPKINFISGQNYYGALFQGYHIIRSKTYRVLLEVGIVLRNESANTLVILITSFKVPLS